MYVYKLNNVYMCMIIYHHENMYYEMMLLTWFVVIDDSQDVHEDVTTVVSVYSTSAVHDTCGKVFVIVLSYNITYDVSEMTTVLVKNNCRWFVYDHFCEWFLMLLTARNCVYLCQYVLSIFVYVLLSCTVLNIFLICTIFISDMLYFYKTRHKMYCYKLKHV